MANGVDNDDDFKEALTVIKELENQLLYFSDKDHFSQEKDRIQKEIENCFESCVLALQTRKLALLNKLDDTFQNTEIENEKSKVKIEATLVASRKLLKAGMRSYEISNIVGNGTFKTIQLLKPEPLNRDNIKVKLPDSFIHIIQSYGEVLEVTNHIVFEKPAADAPPLSHSPHIKGPIDTEKLEQAGEKEAAKEAKEAKEEKEGEKKAGEKTEEKKAGEKGEKAVEGEKVAEKERETKQNTFPDNPPTYVGFTPPSFSANNNPLPLPYYSRRKPKLGRR